MPRKFAFDHPTDAIAMLANQLAVVSQTETLDAIDCVGRTLACDVVADRGERGPEGGHLLRSPGEQVAGEQVEAPEAAVAQPAEGRGGPLGRRGSDRLGDDEPRRH